MGGCANIVSAVAFMSRAKAPEISPFRHDGPVRVMGMGRRERAKRKAAFNRIDARDISWGDRCGIRRQKRVKRNVVDGLNADRSS